MTVTVSSGVTSSGLTVSASDPLIVLSGGTVVSSTIMSGGSATLSAGAVGSSLMVSAGGLLAGGSGGVAYLDGYTMVAGSVSNLTTDDSLQVLSGGRATDVAVDGGVLFVSAGATLSNARATSSTVAIAGSASGLSNDCSDVSIESGGVTVGGSVRGIPNLDESDVYLAFQFVESGGVASQTTILGASEQLVSSGALAIGTTVSGAYLGSGVGGPEYTAGVQIVSSGGVASTTLVLNGGSAQVEAGGTTVGDVVESGGILVLSSGAAASDIQNSGTVEFDDVTLNGNGALQTVLSGVTGDGAFELVRVVVEGDATIDTAQDLVFSGLVVSSGSAVLGSYVVEGAGFVAGSISGITISGVYSSVLGRYELSGLDIVSGGTATDVTLNRSWIGVEYGTTATGIVAGLSSYVAVEGSTTGTLAAPGTTIRIDAGGLTVGDTLHGYEIIESGGVADQTTVLASGDQDVFSGGVASGGRVASGGKVYVSPGGSMIDLTVYGSSTDHVLDTGATTGTILRSGGHQVVSSGGVASDARVLSGSIEYVLSGGIDRGTIVSSGGRELISSGGTASGLSLLAGGAVVDNGAMRFVSAGSLDGVLSGSGQLIKTGSGDLVLTGTGAKFSGETVIGGGTIELAAAGALGTSEVVFVKPSTGSAVLQIDAPDTPKAGSAFANTLSSFDGAGEGLDLRGLAYSSGASATVSGSTLTLSDGGKTYLFKLAGGMAAGGYTVASDGHGGTTIDPKVAAMAQAAAAFQATSGGLSPVSSATVSGPAAMLAAGATASATGLHG